MGAFHLAYLVSFPTQQLAILHSFEFELSKYLTERYGHDVEVDFVNFKPRPNISKGAGMQELLKSPRTSQ